MNGDLNPTTQVLSDLVMEALNETVIWEDRHIGDLEWHLCDIIAEKLMPFVHDQQNKAVDEFVSQVATAHAYNGADDPGQRFYDWGLNPWLRVIADVDEAEDPVTKGLLGYGRYNDDPEHIGCPRARTDMTPCVARDGKSATSHAVCVGCGEHPIDLLVELVREASQHRETGS